MFELLLFALSPISIPGFAQQMLEMELSPKIVKPIKGISVWKWINWLFMLVWQGLHWRSIGWGPKRPLGCIIPQGSVTPHRSLLPSPPSSCNATSCGVHGLAVEAIAPSRGSVPDPLSSNNLVSASSPIRGILPTAGDELTPYSQWQFLLHLMYYLLTTTSENLFGYWEKKNMETINKHSRDNTSSPLPSLSFPYVYPGLQSDSPRFFGETKGDTNGWL